MTWSRQQGIDSDDGRPGAGLERISRDAGGRLWPATATCTGSIQDMLEDADGRIWIATRSPVLAARLQ